MLVIAGLGMVALVGAVGLVIDVGFAWAGNRATQNGADAAAHAGAIVIVREIASDGVTESDAAVLGAVQAVAAENEIVVDGAVEYTDWLGNPVGQAVGTAPDGTIPGAAQGVAVTGMRTHTTVVAGVVGVTSLAMRASATAIAGPASDPCPAVDICALVPITFPTTVVTCDGQNRSQPAEDANGNPYEWLENTNYIIPLCGNNPGSVGWLDWDPPAGGTDELADEICDPNPPDLDLPDWFEVTSTGNVNAQRVEDCLNTYAGEYILMPMFDATCRTNPGAGSPCTNPAATGQNQWYHFPSYAVFELDFPKGAYINGNNGDACDQAGGNGATSCLVGRFVDAVGGGSVGPIGDTGASPLSQLFVVQLIR